MFQNLCEFSPDYTALLRRLTDPAQMRAHEKIIQFPYSASVENEKTEEELALLADANQVWSSYSVLNVLYSLIQKSKINEHLVALQEGKSAEEIA